MNPLSGASSSSVRFACRAARLRCAFSGQTTSTHLSRCASCQEYFAAEAALTAMLRREAGVTLAALDQAGTELARTVLRSVEHANAADERGTEMPMRAMAWWPRSLAGVAAVVLAVSLFLIQRHGDSTPALPAAPVAAIEPAAVSPDAMLLLETMQSWSARLSESVIPSAGALAVNNPLQDELQSVYADARAALDFLALNFLPQANVASPPEPTRKSTG